MLAMDDGVGCWWGGHGVWRMKQTNEGNRNKMRKKVGMRERERKVNDVYDVNQRIHVDGQCHGSNDERR